MKNEDAATTKIELTTRKIPSSAFLAFALGAMGLSLAMERSGRSHAALFIANWVPTVLILGVYNKIAKTFSAPFSEEQRLSHGGEVNVRRFEVRRDFRH